MGKASAKFMIVHAALQEEDNQLDIQTMCQLAGVQIRILPMAKCFTVSCGAGRTGLQGF